MTMDGETRRERDLLGEMDIPRDAYWGIHSRRAAVNFPISKQSVSPELIHAYGMVKLAACQVNRALATWESRKGEAIEQACSEVAEGKFDESIIVDALQGGAGTSTNMNVNEVIANRALEILDLPKGSYQVISPLDDVNLHQSTNDTYPTALRLAAIRLIEVLEKDIVALQEAFQAKEREFSSIVKIGRTQLQDAVLTTLGREMSAYADVLSRDRWRLYKTKERLRVVNLGGTAIGTGLGAPRSYIMQVTERLRGLTGIGFARAENLIDGTQNADVFVEVSGLLKAYASTLVKISNDLRLISSGPQAGFGEITLPPRQGGSSIMPGKINPVIPEAVVQSAFMYMGYDQAITLAASSGNLELNPFLPLIAHCLLSGIGKLSSASKVLAEFCVKGIKARSDEIGRHLEGASAIATALIPYIGYEKAEELLLFAKEKGSTLREAAVGLGLLSDEQFTQAISSEAVTRLGTPQE
ncbi:aspartate ammonia-lyase [Sediminispirochaeta smaragdinae]|uniref:Fumarate lyase n=1 Tax=Sediminispirochaeta smaragdinae (strain DSM 11293 / JCM 15392 / SEBR 4228) TaxID=573413 RepID=E1R2E5_SEDSS|nr:aspartate ammonia-lyase [Sediminispirochaeta smaragdinae]ADK82505.1 fumarate lyase [Sediminispirochaeta smaragdinae DSM 11293]